MVFGAYSIMALGFSGSAFAAELSNFTKVLEDKGLLTITSAEISLSIVSDDVMFKSPLSSSTFVKFEASTAKSTFVKFEASTAKALLPKLSAIIEYAPKTIKK